jgi:hypothetical protein
MSTNITCKTCLASVRVPPSEEGDPPVDVHASLECGCCTEDHHHGEAAAACPQEHDCAGCGGAGRHADECPQPHAGPCWQGPQAGPKPDGCTVCRPVLIQPSTGTFIPALN